MSLLLCRVGRSQDAEKPARKKMWKLIGKKGLRKQPGKKKGEEAVEKIPMWISFRVRSCAVSNPAAPAWTIGERERAVLYKGVGKAESAHQSCSKRHPLSLLSFSLLVITSSGSTLPSLTDSSLEFLFSASAAIAFYSSRLRPLFSVCKNQVVSLFNCTSNKRVLVKLQLLSFALKRAKKKTSNVFREYNQTERDVVSVKRRSRKQTKTLSFIDRGQFRNDSKVVVRRQSSDRLHKSYEGEKEKEGFVLTCKSCRRLPGAEQH